MKAITIWQPWATLIMIGAKPYEFRSWKPPASAIGEPMAIHAGARPMKAAELRNLRLKVNSGYCYQTGLRRNVALPFLQKLIDQEITLPFGHVLGTVRLGEPCRANQVMHEFGGRMANDSDRDEHFNWAWPMLDIHPIAPIPARGFQGLWEWRV
jgi:hypothetical protein